MFNYEKLRKARKQAKLTMYQTVARIEEEGEKITPATICNHETNNTTPDATTIALYAEIYNVPISYFFTK